MRHLQKTRQALLPSALISSVDFMRRRIVGREVNNNAGQLLLPLNIHYKSIIMANNLAEDNKQKDDNKDAAIKPDPETLNTTDPQEHMEGPISSLMHKTGESFENDESEEEARKKKDNK